ncbi:MAG: nucleotidyltransferase domain-containing protein [Sulfuricurvum sp.]|nr:nucleotidyltransferase domain-containing protein [Sulfuricurvum sp.]
MKLTNALKDQIITQLTHLNPMQVVLFGSYAYGEPTENSDIDLYVVTDDEFIPQNWGEKNRLYLKVAKALENIVRTHPTDLIVHTKAMHREFIAMNSSFSREITTKGVKLYESA